MDGRVDDTTCSINARFNGNPGPFMQMSKEEEVDGRCS
jgi:hypothetical protein